MTTCHFIYLASFDGKDGTRPDRPLLPFDLRLVRDSPSHYMAEGVILPMVGQGWPETTMSGEKLSLKQLVPPDATTPWTRMRVAKLVFAASLVREMVGVGPLTLWFRELTERPSTGT